MLDISRKVTSLRTATARAALRVSSATLDLIRQGAIPKGDPLAVARVAGVQAAKNTSQIIPYCHPLSLEFVSVEFELGDAGITVTTQVKAIYKTGVEMEALTAAAVAALTLYDMLKMVDDSLEVTSVSLLSKRGGKSDFQDEFDVKLRAAVLVMSDSIAAGAKDDRSGRTIVERLKQEGLDVVEYRIVPDEQGLIRETVRAWCDQDRVDLVMTTGGTGLGPRDQTPEAMADLVTREVPGIAEAARAYGQLRTPRSMLSRSAAGVRGQTLIVNLPGSRAGVQESLDALFPGVLHAFHMLWGGGHP